MAAEIYAPFARENKIRAFYSLDESSNKPFIFNVSEKSDFKIDLKLPSNIIPKRITGQVFWSSEIAANNAHIELAKNEEFAKEGEKYIVTDFYDSTVTDENGKFELQAFEGAEYWVHASTYIDIIENGKPENIEIQAKPMKIKIGKQNEPIKIVFEIPRNAVGFH